MSRREALLAPNAHLVPELLHTIRRNSGVRFGADLYRQLSGPLDIDASVVRRQWARWLAGAGAPYGKGGLPRSETLVRLIDHAVGAGWLSREDPRFAALFDALPKQRDRVLASKRAASLRVRKRVRRLVSAALDAGRDDPLPSTFWLATVAGVVAEQLVQAMRVELLGAEAGVAASARNDLLAGAVLSRVTEVEQAFLAGIAQFKDEVRRLEGQEAEAFRAQSVALEGSAGGLPTLRSSSVNRKGRRKPAPRDPATTRARTRT